MNAMILAAGYGTRLAPLTDSIPKSLLPVGNRPQIKYTLDLLSRAGVRHVIINLHHLGGKIRDALGDSYRGVMSLQYSEESSILGTGGGVKRVESFFDESPFIVINADTLIDINISVVVQAHVDRGAVATMVLRERRPGDEFGGVWVDDEDRIVGILDRGGTGRGREATFTGVHVMDREIFSYLRGGAYSCLNRDGYGRMLDAGAFVNAVWMKGYWRDTGTIERYFLANMEFLRNAFMSRYPPGIPEDALVHPGSTLILPVVLDRECVLKSGSSVGPGVIMGSGCQVGEGAVVKRVVALPGTAFAPDERISGMVCAGNIRLPAEQSGFRCNE